MGSIVGDTKETYYCNSCNRNLKKSQVYYCISVPAKIDLNERIFDIEKQVDDFFEDGGMYCKFCNNNIDNK